MKFQKKGSLGELYSPMSRHKKCIHCQQIARNKLKKQYCWQLLQIKWNSKVCILLKGYMISILSITVSCLQLFREIQFSLEFFHFATYSRRFWTDIGLECPGHEVSWAADSNKSSWTLGDIYIRPLPCEGAPSKAPLSNPLSRKYQQPLVLRRMESRQSTWLIKFFVKLVVVWLIGNKHKGKQFLLTVLNVLF